MHFNKVKQELKRIYATLPLGNKVKKNCPFCRCQYNFLSYGNKYDAFNNMNVIGGGHRKNVRCPICNGIDRTRWCYYVLSNYTDVFEADMQVLHIAPEGGLTKLIKENANVQYTSGDIVPGRADVICDLTNLQFKEGSFDMIIVNHVLEHITNEDKAISEMKRVLKDSGIIVCSFPICFDINTFEDDKIVTRKDKIKYYGQDDHVRLYGRDAKQHLESFGLIVEEYWTDRVLTKDKINEFNLLKKDCVFLCKKAVH